MGFFSLSQVDSELSIDSITNRGVWEFGVVTRAEMSFDKATGQNKGFGFISFARVEDADRAIASLQGQFINGKAIRIEKTKEDGAPPASQVPAAGAWGAMPMHPAMMQQAAAYPGYPPAGAMRF